MCYFLQLAAKYLLYAPTHREDSIYHSVSYTSCGILAGMSKYKLDEAGLVGNSFTSCTAVQTSIKGFCFLLLSKLQTYWAKMFCISAHSIHLIYTYMASDIGICCSCVSVHATHLVPRLLFITCCVMQLMTVCLCSSEMPFST